MPEWAKEADFDEILQKANVIFGGEGNTDYFQLYHPKLYAVRNSATEHLVVRTEEGIQGFVGLFPAEMEVCGRKIRVDGIGTVGVLEGARGKGYMKDLMRTAVEASKKRADIAFLSGRRQRYEYFGFTPSGVAGTFSFNRDNARHVVKDTDLDGYTFTEAKTAEEAKFFSDLYDRRPARVLRSADDFITMLQTCRSTAICIRKNGGLCGYASVNGGGRTINEIELTDINELSTTLAAYLKFYDLKSVTVCGVYLFEREKLKALDSVCESMELSGSGSFLIYDYVKIIDAFLALKASYTKLFPCNAVLEIEGRERIAVDIGGNGFRVCQTHEPPDVRLTPIEATRALFGGTAYLGTRDDFPADLRANLPLPLFYSYPDNV